MSLDTLFWTLLWDDITIFWDGKLSKQTSYWSKTAFSSQLKIIINFHPKNVPKYQTKRHEQVSDWQYILVVRINGRIKRNLNLNIATIDLLALSDYLMIKISFSF